MVKGRAIETYGALLRNFPEQNEEACLDLIIDSLVDKYVFVHKKAANLSYSIFPFLDTEKLRIWTIGLLNLEAVYYKEKDFRYCKELIDKLLFVTREKAPSMYKVIVTNLVVKYCNCKDYYTEKDFIKKLTYLSKNELEFKQIWVTTTLSYLTRTQPDRYNTAMDERNKLFDALYKTNYSIIENNKDLIVSFVKDRIDKEIYSDIASGYGLLASFSFWTELNNLTTYFKTKIPTTAAYDYINSFNASAERITLTELKVIDKELTPTFIKSLKGI